MGFKKVTLAEAIEAMRQNNIPVYTGGLLHTDGYGHIKSACAMGQCAINLGVEPASIDRWFRGILLGNTSLSLSAYIARHNDDYRISPDKVSDMVLSKIDKNLLEAEIQLPTAFSIVALKVS